MTLLYAILSVLAAWAAWWLSGYDPKVTRENPAKDFLRRILRILATVALVAVFFGLRPAGLASGYGFVPLLLMVPISLGLLWCGCISEWCSLELHRFLFFGARGEFDPDQDVRELGNLAMLLKTGRHAEALQLIKTIRRSAVLKPRPF